MEDQLISFETAKLAKEKCFDYKSRHAYLKGKLVPLDISNKTLGELYSDIVQCPTQSLLQRWLRETHHLSIITLDDTSGTNKYWYTIGKIFTPTENCSESEFNTYEEALEIALQQALKLI